MRLALAVEASRLQLRRKRKTDDVAPLEAAAEQLVATIFREQSRRLKPPADLTNGTASLRALDARWATVTRATARAAAAALSEALQAAYGEGAARFASELGAASEARIRFKAPPSGPDEIPLDDLGHAVLDGTVFKVRNPRAVKFLDRHAAKLVAGIDDATRNTLRVVVRDGVANGRSSQKIAKDISSRFADMADGRPQAHIASRAHGIAVTEMSFGYEAGQRAVADDVAAAGIAMEKSWLTVGDGRVDDLCEGDATDGWIPLKDTFSSGDQEPPAHPACRCTALHQPASEQPAAKPAPEPEAEAEAEPAAWTDRSTAEAEFTKRHGTKLTGFGKMDADTSLAVLNRVDELQLRFPAKITKIRVGKLPGGTIAETTNVGIDASEMVLNAKYWRKGSRDMKRLLQFGDESGFHVPGASNPKGLITHEYGHSLQATLGGGKRGVKLIDRFEKWSNNIDWADVTSAGEFQPHAVTGYGVGNAEGFAEAFTAHVFGELKADRIVKSLGRFLVTNFGS